MISNVEPKPRTYRQILLTPLGSKIFAILLLLSIIFIAITLWMVSVTPHNYSGTAGPDGVEIDVPFSSVQPATIKMSHDFHLVSMRGALFIGYFYVDGPDPANYTINITDSSGTLVRVITGQIDAPEEYAFTLGQHDAVATVEREEQVMLSPGKYALTFRSDTAFKYQVVQKSMFEMPSLILGLLGALCVLWVFVDLYVAYKTWERENRKPVIPSMPAYYPPPVMYYPPAVTIPYHDAGYSIEPVAPPSTDREVIDYMCAKCGNIIQNPVVQNVITCERCGEKEYVG